jgi:hypothetical protein
MISFFLCDCFFHRDIYLTWIHKEAVRISDWARYTSICPIQKAKKATFNYGAAKIIPLRMSYLLDFCKFPNRQTVENNYTCPIRGPGPQGLIQNTGDQFPRDV